MPLTKQIKNTNFNCYNDEISPPGAANSTGASIFQNNNSKSKYRQIVSFKIKKQHSKTYLDT